MDKYVIILNFSAEDQDGICDRWKETFICDENTTIKEVMKWANRSFSTGNPIITKATEATK